MHTLLNISIFFLQFMFSFFLKITLVRDTCLIQHHDEHYPRSFKNATECLKHLITFVNCIKLIVLCFSLLLFHVMIIFGVIILCQTGGEHRCQHGQGKRTLMPAKAQNGTDASIQFCIQMCTFGIQFFISLHFFAFQKI